MSYILCGLCKHWITSYELTKLKDHILLIVIDIPKRQVKGKLRSKQINKDEEIRQSYSMHPNLVY